MDIELLVKKLNSEDYQNMVTAVETGRWLDGQLVTEQQKNDAMQVMMLYQSYHNLSAQHLTINSNGEIEKKSKSELKNLFKQP